MSSIEPQYSSYEKDIVVTYRMMHRDSRGLLLEEPYLGMSMNNNDFYPVSRIIEMAKVIEERGLDDISTKSLIDKGLIK